MHVLFQVKVPIDLANGLRDRLKQVEIVHMTEAVNFKKRLKVSTAPEKLEAENAMLIARARRMTIHSLLREVLRSGFDAVSKMDTKTLIEHMAKDDVVKGRPTLGLVEGTKRGG